MLIVTTMLALATQATHPEFPPVHLYGVYKRGAAIYSTYPKIGGSAKYDTAKQEVIITWHAYFNDQNVKRTTQRESTTFWPTEVCTLGVNKLVVSGKRANGKTVIQLWEFDTSEPAPYPYNNPATGETHYPEIVIPVLSRTTVYKDDIEGRGMVAAMWENRGRPGSVFLLSEDSHEIYDFDLNDRSWTKILTPDIIPGIEHQPYLANNFYDRRQWSLSTGGFVFALFRGSGNQPFFYMFDSDSDGVLDPGMSQSMPYKAFFTAYEALITRDSRFWDNYDYNHLSSTFETD